MRKPSEHKKMVDLWFAFFESNRKFKPLFTPREANNMRLIRLKLTELSQNPSELFEYILQNWSALPKFVKENYSLAVLYSNFNQVLIILQDRKQKADEQREIFGSFDCIE